ncbi:MAG TPA: glycosyltransferase [Blastocatellia bacterium]|nr:glycosyltransferase [Blastocatellia bacterium]
MRILWLKTELLHPVDKGGKIRTYQMLKRISRLHDVTYLTLASHGEPADAFASAGEYCARLVHVPWSEPRKFGARFYADLAFNIGSDLPYAIQKYRSAEMKKAIARECLANDYDLVVCDFLTPAINYTHDPARPAVLFQHNVESGIWRRHFETQTNRVKKAFFYSQWQKMYRYERDACRAFNAVIAVSRADREQMRDEFDLNEVYDVPTGVDTRYFRPLGNRPEPHNLVFTGSMDWMPNEDAIIYFAENIFPQITRRLPHVTLTVVGRNPSRRLKAIAEANNQIKVTGRVDDVRPFIDAASAYVVPLRVGGGTRLKIYEAMAMRKPVISTTVGAEGLPVAAGKELLIADDPEAFAAAVTRVLKDARLRERIGRQARATVCAHHGWERSANDFMKICEGVVGSRSRMHAA